MRIWNDGALNELFISRELIAERPLNVLTYLARKIASGCYFHFPCDAPVPSTWVCKAYRAPIAHGAKKADAATFGPGDFPGEVEIEMPVIHGLGPEVFS